MPKLVKMVRMAFSTPGAGNGGNQRLEDADHVIQDQIADVLFAGGSSRSGGRRSVEAAQLDQLVIHLDDVVADDHLTLRPACDDAHDTGGLLRAATSALAGSARVNRSRGGAVLQMGHIFVAATRRRTSAAVCL